MTLRPLHDDAAVITSASAVIGRVAKDGREPDENEDRADAGPRRAAVADGASTSARAEVWAEILVQAFVNDHKDPFDPQVLTQLRQLWHDTVHRPDLPWYATAKLRDGGAAAFVGLELDPDSQRYSVCAIGDACLLHLRGPELLSAVPVERWERFGRFPTLVTTKAADDSHRPTLWRDGDYYRPGDIFVLASDALAKYLLRRHQQQGRPIDPRVALDGDFASWVASARLHDDLDNDDTTVCVVSV